MGHFSTGRWRAVLAGLIIVMCACNFPLYPGTLDVQIEPEEPISVDWGNLPLETSMPIPNPTSTLPLTPTQPALPSGGLIILESDRDGNREIYSLHADGSNPVNLSNSPDEELIIECSPDGQWVLYSIVEEGSLKIYLMDIWGKEKTLAFVLPGQEAHGIWVDPDAIFLDIYNGESSPTTYLASWSGGSWEIREVPSGSGADLVPKYLNFNGYTLDMRVENYGSTDLDFEIYLIEGNAEKNLTNHPAWDMFPMWSADGSEILFSSERNGENSDLFLMDRDGNILRQLTQSDSNDLAYCWIH